MVLVAVAGASVALVVVVGGGGGGGGGGSCFKWRRLLKYSWSASSSVYGRHTACMGSLARDAAELVRAGRALSCAMILAADFGFRSCALTLFSCVLVMRTCGETPPWSVSCPTMRERRTKADCFARRSAFEGDKAKGPFFAWSLDAAGAVVTPGSSVVGESGDLGLRNNLKLAGKDERGALPSGERREAESDCPVAAGITPDADLGSTDDVFCTVAGSPEGGSGDGASVGLSPAPGA
jgi:hypothetical protein